MDDFYEQAATKIIKQQQGIIGPLAIEQARRVAGISVDSHSHEVSLTGDKSAILQHLVEQYRKLFGQTSVEVCKDAIRPLLSKLPSQEIPALLK